MTSSIPPDLYTHSHQLLEWYGCCVLRPTIKTGRAGQHGNARPEGRQANGARGSTWWVTAGASMRWMLSAMVNIPVYNSSSQHMVSTWSAHGQHHGQHTASTWSAHGQQTVSTRPAPRPAHAQYLYLYDIYFKVKVLNFTATAYNGCSLFLCYI